MDITKNIKAIRESKGFSQGKMAELLQMERANYHRLENRNTKMSIDQLQSIADALGVSLGELLGVEGTNGTNDGERVRELEKRVKELEDRIRDKDYILKSVENERMTLEVLIFQALSDAVNHSSKIGDYEVFIFNNHWLVILLSGIQANSLKIKDKVWKRFWRVALNRFIKNVENGVVMYNGQVHLGETYYSLISEPATSMSIDDYMEWVYDVKNEVVTVSFYLYLPG